MSIKCEKCNGSGLIDANNMCVTCNGSGVPENIVIGVKLSNFKIKNTESTKDSPTGKSLKSALVNWWNSNLKR